MRRFFTNPYLPYLITGLILLGALDWAARHYSLYFILPHLDKVSHILAGICLGWCSLMVIHEIPLRYRRPWLIAMAGAFIFGAIWELKEFVLNNWLGSLPFDVGDTITDLLCDTLGGFISYFFITHD